MASQGELFHDVTPGPALISNLAVTDAGALGLVLDRRDLADPDGDLIGFTGHIDAVAAGAADNYITLVLYEADEKDSTTVLTSGTKVDDDDLIGWCLDGVRQVTDNPDYDSSASRTVQAALPYIADGTTPKINATTMADKTFWFAYRGSKDCLQVYAEEVGTGSITVTVFPIYASLRTRNLVNVPPIV